jgi:hypothetical protein
MNHDDMLRLFETHREAEAARDFDAILATFTADCFLETVPLGLRGEGKIAARAAYEVPPSGGSFAVPFTNVAPFRDGLMAGESIYVDLATLCEQAGLDVSEIRAAAKARAAGGSSGLS